MGHVKIDKKKLEELLKSNAQLRKELAAMGIKLNNLEDINELSDEAQRAVLRANYDRLTEGGIIIVPVECGAGQHWDEALGKCVDNTIPIPEPHPQAGKDQYGVTKIYKDKEGGAFITSDKFTEEEFTRNYASGKPSENSYENEFKSSQKLDNVEATFYVKINGFKKEPDTLSIKLLGGDHTKGSSDKWQIFEIMTDGSDTKTFEIEDPHPSNHGNHVQPLFNLDQTVVGKWIGVKAVTYLIDQGTDASAETWIDFPVEDINNPPNKWRKYIDIASLKNCDHGFVKATGGNVLLRIDGTKKGDMPEVKYQSLREILPEGNVPDQPPTIPPVTEPPVPVPPTEPTTGNVLYDSTIGKWNRNITITGADPDFPKPFVGGKGMEIHASGNPVFKFDGTGIGTLEAGPGHGRTYIDCNNNGSILEYELRFNDTNIENHTCQLRSRHQEGDPPENRQGGDSFKIDLRTVGLKLEKFHNEHISGAEKPHNLSLKVGEWIKVKLTDKPDYTKGEIYQSIELNGQKVIEGTQKNLPPYLMKKEDYDKRSYLWLRVNNVKKGSVSFRNIKLTAL